MSESHEIEQIARAAREALRGYKLLGGVFSDAAAQVVARAILPLIRAAEERGAESMRDRAASTALNPPFIEATDTDWDEGVNFAKRFIAKSIRALPPIKEG